MTGGVRKEGEFWVCPRGCFSRDGIPNCEHTRALDDVATLLLEAMEGEYAPDPVDTLFELMEGP